MSNNFWFKYEGGGYEMELTDQNEAKGRVTVNICYPASRYYKVSGGFNFEPDKTLMSFKYFEDKWALTALGRNFECWTATRTNGSTVENIKFVGIEQYSGM